eukprot:3794527-Alexandrium_andersonii.AAC.1
MLRMTALKRSGAFVRSPAGTSGRPELRRRLTVHGTARGERWRKMPLSPSHRRHGCPEDCSAKGQRAAQACHCRRVLAR